MVLRDTRDGTNVGNTPDIDEADTTSGQGGADPDENPDNGRMPVGDIDTESLQQFFNLDIEQQAETLIHYQQHLSQVCRPKQTNGRHDDKINVNRQGLTTQVETALKQNADLLKTLKETPSVETITNQVKDTLDKEYELKFKEPRRSTGSRKTSPGGITQRQLKKAG